MNPTPDELSAISSPQLAAPGETTPDPEPEVLQRAQIILDAANAGKNLSQVSEGEQGLEVADSGLALSAQQKLLFMAHVMEGAPYEVTYTAFGHLRVIFRTMTLTEEDLLKALVDDDVVQGIIKKAQRGSRYHRYAVCMSLKLFGGVEQSPFPQKGSLSAARSAYDAWLTSCTGGQYHLLDTFYRKFIADLEELYRRVDDADFWPTPLSP